MNKHVGNLHIFFYIVSGHDTGRLLYPTVSSVISVVVVQVSAVAERVPRRFWHGGLRC